MRRSSAGSGPEGGAVWALQPAVRPRTSSPAKKRKRINDFLSGKDTQQDSFAVLRAIDSAAVMYGAGKAKASRISDAPLLKLAT